MSLKKHTEAWVTEHTNSIMTPDISKHFDNDLDGSRANESSEDIATTPSSSKHTKRRLLQERTQKKTSVDASIGGRRQNKAKPKLPLQCDSMLLSNHLEGHIHLSNKKALYYNMKTYYESLDQNPFDYIPLTFHIKDGVDSEEFKLFTEEYNKIQADLEDIDPKK